MTRARYALYSRNLVDEKPRIQLLRHFSGIAQYLTSMQQAQHLLSVCHPFKSHNLPSHRFLLDCLRDVSDSAGGSGTVCDAEYLHHEHFLGMSTSISILEPWKLLWAPSCPLHNAAVGIMQRLALCSLSIMWLRVRTCRMACYVGVSQPIS
jgi:hypothetical protein